MSEADQAMLVMPVGPRDAPDDILASVRALSGASRGLSLVVVAGYHIDATLWASLRDLPALPVPLRVFPQAGPVTETDLLQQITAQSPSPVVLALRPGELPAGDRVERVLAAMRHLSCDLLAHPTIQADAEGTDRTSSPLSGTVPVRAEEVFARRLPTHSFAWRKHLVTGFSPVDGSAAARGLEQVLLVRALLGGGVGWTDSTTLRLPAESADRPTRLADLEWRRAAPVMGVLASLAEIGKIKQNNHPARALAPRIQSLLVPAYLSQVENWLMIRNQLLLLERLPVWQAPDRPEPKADV